MILPRTSASESALESTQWDTPSTQVHETLEETTRRRMPWMRLEGAEPLANIATGRSGGLQLRFGELWEAADGSQGVRADVERNRSTLRVGESVVRSERWKETGPEETSLRGWKTLLEDVPGVFDHVPKAFLQECDENEHPVVGNCVATFPENGVRMKGDKHVHLLFRTAGKWDQECVMHTFNSSSEAAEAGKDLTEVGRLDAGFPVRLLSCSRCPTLITYNAPGMLQTTLPDQSHSHPPIVAAVGMYDACIISPSYSGIDHRWTMERGASGSVASRPISDFAWNHFLQQQGILTTEGGQLTLVQVASSGSHIHCRRVGEAASPGNNERPDQSQGERGSWKCTWGSSPSSVIHSSQKNIRKVDLRERGGFAPLFSIQHGIILGVEGLWPTWDNCFLSQVRGGTLPLSQHLGDLSCLYVASSTSRLYLLDDRYPGQPVLSWERAPTSAWDDILVPFANHRVQESTEEYSLDISIGLSSSNGTSLNCFPFTVSLEKKTNDDAFAVLGAGYNVVARGLPFQMDHSCGEQRNTHGTAIFYSAGNESPSRSSKLFALSSFAEGQFCLKVAQLEASALTLSRNASPPRQSRAIPPEGNSKKAERKPFYLPLICGVIFQDIDFGEDSVLPHDALDLLQSQLQQSTHPLTGEELASRMYAEQGLQLSSMQLTEVPWFPQKKLYGHKNCTCRVCTRMSRKRTAAASHPLNKPILHMEDALDFFRAQTSYVRFVVEMADQIECESLEDLHSSVQRDGAHNHLVLFDDKMVDIIESWLENPSSCAEEGLRIRQKLLSTFMMGEC